MNTDYGGRNVSCVWISQFGPKRNLIFGLTFRNRLELFRWCLGTPSSVYVYRRFGDKDSMTARRGDLPERGCLRALGASLVRFEVTDSRIPLLIVLSAVIGNPCAEALWAQTHTLPSGNAHWVNDRDAE